MEVQVLKQNKTSIIIAHRLTTIRNADNIIFLDQGQIIESGTHDELIRCSKCYSKLYKNQFIAV